MIEVIETCGIASDHHYFPNGSHIVELRRQGITVGYVDKSIADLLTQPTSESYKRDCLRTESAKDPIEGNSSLSRILHVIFGLVTESGELADAVKKHLFYGKTLDLVNLIEELGDVEWYLSILYDVLNVSREQVWDKNIRKLKARYPEKFTEFHAENRDLQQERKELET